MNSLNFSAIRTAKGDFIVDGAEFLIQLVIRIYGKALGKSSPSEWELKQWIIFVLFTAICIAIVWFAIRWRKSKNDGLRSRD